MSRDQQQPRENLCQVVIQTHEILINNPEADSLLSDVKIMCKGGTLFYSRLLLSITKPFLKFIEPFDYAVIIWPDLSLDELISDLSSIIGSLRDDQALSSDLYVADSADTLNFLTSSCESQGGSNELYQGPAFDYDNYNQNQHRVTFDVICDEFKTPEKRSVNQEDGHMCELCGGRYESKEKLVKHVKWKHQERNYDFQCSKCLKKFQSKFMLKRHFVTHEDPKFKCEYCDKAFKRQFHLTAHVGTAHENEGLKKQFNCTKCGKVFNKNSNLKRHLKVHESEEIKTFQCLLCDKSYHIQYHLERHLESHMDTTYNCDKCGKIFNREDNLLRHSKICNK